jgi:heat shock protein HslJ
MRRLVACGVIAASGFMASACGDSNPAGGTASRLEGSWALVAFEPAAGGVAPVSDPQAYTLEFGSGGALSARADCNQCQSSYEAQGVALSVGGLACTRVACAPGSRSNEFIAAVSAASSYLRHEQTLFLYYPGGRLRLEGN